MNEPIEDLCRRWSDVLVESNDQNLWMVFGGVR